MQYLRIARFVVLLTLVGGSMALGHHHANQQANAVPEVHQQDVPVGDWVCIRGGVR